MVEINNLTRFKFDKKRLEILVGKVLSKEKRNKTELLIAFVKPDQIRKLNKKYRKKNTATDVLSFMFEGSGEIILCPAVIKRNAKDLSENFKKELERVLIHGILHVLGYDHEKKDDKMMNKQEYYLF
ncbi:MAG: rRNA maturation RNase YbeY [Parcubacteria group bacterium]